MSVISRDVPAKREHHDGQKPDNATSDLGAVDSRYDEMRKGA